MPAPVDITDPFRALADPTRRKIIGLLAAGTLPVRMIASNFPAISRPAVSKHLRILREGGLVSERRSGRERYYALDFETVESTQSWLAEVLAASGRRSRRAPLSPTSPPRARAAQARSEPSSKKPSARRRKARPATSPVDTPPGETPTIEPDDWKSW